MISNWPAGKMVYIEVSLERSHEINFTGLLSSQTRGYLPHKYCKEKRCSLVDRICLSYYLYKWSSSYQTFIYPIKIMQILLLFLQKESIYNFVIKSMDRDIILYLMLKELKSIHQITGLKFYEMFKDNCLYNLIFLWLRIKKYPNDQF